MAERADCRAAEQALQRAAVGAARVGHELEAALAHVRSCAVCSRRFELAAARAYPDERDTVPAMAELPVEPTALFEGALTAALSEPEAIVRRRAAERLGDFERLGMAALAALVRAAGLDRDESVRDAALDALDRLDEGVSLTLRVAEEAGPWNRLAVRSGSETLGEIVRTEDQYWLKLNRLPETFERSNPVLAVPAALEAGEAPIEWAGERPGLVVARQPVADGALDLFLGRAQEPAAERALFEGLFSRVYLLSPREEGGRL